MDYLAVIQNEGRVEMPWFVYVESKHAPKNYACRFGQRASAERVASAMNRAWQQEGRLLVRGRES